MEGGSEVGCVGGAYVVGGGIGNLFRHAFHFSSDFIFTIHFQLFVFYKQQDVDVCNLTRVSHIFFL